MRTITATELKATCLSLIEEVERTGEPVIVTKRGRPMVRVVPLPASDSRGELMGTVHILGDIETPSVPADEWDAETAAP